MILSLYETEAKLHRNDKETKIGGGEKERGCLLFFKLYLQPASVAQSLKH